MDGMTDALIIISIAIMIRLIIYLILDRRKTMTNQELMDEYENLLDMEEELTNRCLGFTVTLAKGLYEENQALEDEVGRLKGLLEKTADTCPACSSGVTKINKDEGKRYCYNCRNTSSIDDEE